MRRIVLNLAILFALLFNRKIDLTGGAVLVIENDNTSPQNSTVTSWNPVSKLAIVLA